MMFINESEAYTSVIELSRVLWALEFNHVKCDTVIIDKIGSSHTLGNCNAVV